MKIFPHFKNTQAQDQAGYTLIEVVTYFSILSAVSVFALISLFSTIENFSRLQASQEALASGRTAIDRLVFEIRRASVVDAQASVFSGEEEALVLERENESGETVTTTFSLQDNALVLSIDGVPQGALTRENAAVTLFDVEYFDAAHGSAVKMNITVLGENNGVTTEESFQNTVLLRNRNNS